MITNLGTIKLERILSNTSLDYYIKATLDSSVLALDQLEATGETISEALINLHQEVENYER
jgi:hypothetical protein